MCLVLCVCVCWPGVTRAQDNYEIQVYPSETMTPRTLLVELHSNFTVEGSTTTQFGMLPTQHQQHETIELTQGINEWSEVGFYIFTAEKSGNGIQWAGDHIRPRVRVPPRWHWPVGVSLSSEFGYARAAFSNPTWSWQIMPIVDQTIAEYQLNKGLNFGFGYARMFAGQFLNTTTPGHDYSYPYAYFEYNFSKSGFVNVFDVGSTAAIGTIEFEPGLQHDLPAILDKLIPLSRNYSHEQTWHDGNGYCNRLHLGIDSAADRLQGRV